MRIRHIFTFDQLIHADLATIAAEYRSIAGATDHEFRSEAERGRYTALVRAYGLFTYGERFAATLAEIGEADQAAVKPVCSHCGSDSLVRDAPARWDEDAQDWTLSAVYDATFCDLCSSESDRLCKWVPLPETAGKIDAQAYPLAGQPGTSARTTARHHVRGMPGAGASRAAPGISDRAPWIAEPARRIIEKIADAVVTMKRETATAAQHAEQVARECTPLFESLGMTNEGDGWSFDDLAYVQGTDTRLREALLGPGDQEELRATLGRFGWLRAFIATFDEIGAADPGFKTAWEADDPDAAREARSEVDALIDAVEPILLASLETMPVRDRG
ncbi:hypothetical protein [Sphingomonas oryzagri]